MTKCKNFGNYLKILRKKLRLTQKDLANILSINFKKYLNIEISTISRWEQNQTCPGIEKISEILYFFYKEYEIDFYETFNFIQSLERNSSKFNPKPHDAIQIAKVPMDLRNIRFAFLNKIQKGKRDKIIQDIIKFDNHIYPTEFPVTPEIMKHWLNSNNYFLIVTREGHWIGHFIGLFVSDYTYSLLINHKMEESDISFYKLKDIRKNLYIYSFFSINPLIGGRILKRAFLYILKRRKNIKNIGALCITKDSKRLAKNFQLKLFTKGKLKNKVWEIYSRKIEKIIYNANTIRKLI